MKNRNIFNLLLFMFVGLSLVSCDKGGDPDPGATKVVDMAGDWYVKLMIDGEDVYHIGYYLLSTYNTAANDGQEMWVDDHELWPTKVKVPVNVESMTFEGSTLNNLYSYELQGETISPDVTITDGKVLMDAATTSGGNTADSIHMNIEFSDDPGTVYTIAGYRRTGLLEDEHGL